MTSPGGGVPPPGLGQKMFHEQISVIEADPASLDIANGEITLGSVDATFITGGWEFDNFDLSLLDFGHAQAAMGWNGSKLELGAMASIWTPSITWSIGNVDISLCGHVGSVGGTINIGENGIKVGASGGWGVSLSIEWD